MKTPTEEIVSSEGERFFKKVRERFDTDEEAWTAIARYFRDMVESAPNSTFGRIFRESAKGSELQANLSKKNQK